MLNPARLAEQDAASAARLAGAQRLGFRPAFLDCATMCIHDLDSVQRDALARPAFIAGFERRGFFYTNSAVARACQEWPTHG
jgi:hypothetical protein